MGQESNTKSINQADKKLVDLMHFGLDHGVESIKIKGKGPLVPFVVIELNGEKELTRFLRDKPEDGVKDGIRSLKEAKESQFAVLVHDGYLTVAGQKFNAVIAKGFDRNDTVGYSLAQRYSPKKFFSSFKSIGKPSFVGNAEQLLNKST